MLVNLLNILFLSVNTTCTEQYYFEISKEVLGEMMHNGLPEEFKGRLKPLKNRKFISEQAFLKAAEELIGTEHVAEYQDLLIKYALQKIGPLKRIGDSERINTSLVYYFKDTTVQQIAPSPVENSSEIPEQLIIEPGAYRFLGGEYPLEKEGLYRFFFPEIINAQRIVYQHDLDALLSSLSWIATHGNSDDPKSNIELSDKALKSKLFITCGKISGWAHELLVSLNIKSRIVLGITADDWNTYDNGHTLLEIWRTEWNKWVVYDLDQNAYFIDKRTRVPLSVLEFNQSVERDEYEIIPLSNDTRLDVSNFSGYGLLVEVINANIRDWYRRVMQVVLIYSPVEQKWLFPNLAHKAKIESYSTGYKYVDMETFMQKFYNHDN